MATAFAVPAGFNRADWRSASDCAGSRLRLSASGDGARLRSTSMPPAATPGSSEPWPPRPERTAAPGSSGAAVKPLIVAISLSMLPEAKALANSGVLIRRRVATLVSPPAAASSCLVLVGKRYGGLLFAGGSVAALLAHTLLSIEGRLLPGICAALLLTLDAERGGFTPKAFERPTECAGVAAWAGAAEDRRG